MKKPIKKSTSIHQQQKQHQHQTGISEQNFKIYLRIKPTLPGSSSFTSNANLNQNSTNNNNVNNNGFQSSVHQYPSTPTLLIPQSSSSHSSSHNNNININNNNSNNVMHNNAHNANTSTNTNTNTNNSNSNSNNILKILPYNKIQITSPYYTVNQIDRIYSYQQIFDDAVNNSMVFQKTMLQPVDNVLNGYNSTVFIYGMTGSGKTYTMFGTAGNITTKHNNNINMKGMDEDGLVPMTIDYMFAQIDKQPHIKSQITVSFYQIYNENIRDLLTTSNNNSNNNYMNYNNNYNDQPQQQPSLVIMQDPIHGIFVNGLTQITAQDKNEIKDIIYAGVQKRAMNATRSNQVSSRSHAILQFSVKRYIHVNTHNNTINTHNNSNNNVVGKGGNAGVLQSKFFMIDLAGNEKTANNNESRRFIQGININKSLLTLGKCLSILAQRKSSYVPFRDSKLTRILKQSLGGNSKTVMIACVSSQRRFYQQTLNTLKYSNIARKIKNKGVKHNFKIITKEQMPDCKNFINNGLLSSKSGNMNGHNHGEIQQKIKNILSSFLSSVQSKIKIQQFLQNLQNNRKQNEQFLNKDDMDYQACKNNIKKINDTINLFTRPYQKYLQKVYQSYNQLMENIKLIIVQQKQKDKYINVNVNVNGHDNGSIQEDIADDNQDNNNSLDANAEIIRLKEIIAHQNRKLEYYQSKQIKQKNIHSLHQNINNNYNKNAMLMMSESKNEQFDNFAHRSLQNNIDSNNHSNSNMYNNMCNKQIKINLSSSIPQKQNTQPTFNFNPKSGNPSHNQFNHHEQRSQSRPNKKLTINCGNPAIYNQDSHRSSATALQILNTSNISACSRGASNNNDKKYNKFQKQIVINLNAEQVDKKNYQNSRQQFVKRLKQTERKAKGVGAEEISDLLKQQQNNRYGLGNVQLSMIRKLKFFQREKSIQKSNSLGKLHTKTYEPIRMGLRRN